MNGLCMSANKHNALDSISAPEYLISPSVVIPNALLELSVINLLECMLSFIPSISFDNAQISYKIVYILLENFNIVTRS